MQKLAKIYGETVISFSCSFPIFPDLFTLHRVKSDRIRNHSGPRSPASWPNTERYGRSECGKMRTRITPNTDTFYAVLSKYSLSGIICLSNFFHIFPSVSPFNIFILCYNFKASLNFSTHTPSEFRKLSKCNHFFFKMLFRMFTFGQIGIFESFQLWLETLLSKYFNFLQKLRLFKKFESLKTQKAK